jgi:transposase
MVEVDLAMIAAADEQIREMELHLVRHAKVDDPLAYQLLQTIPGIGKVLALVLLYEMHEARRFASEREFVSYCRLVRPSHESAGKVRTGKNHKIGNAYLRWAFGEAACLMLRELPAAESFAARMEKKHGKAKAISILAARIARTAWLMLKRKDAFDTEKFFKK